MAMPCVRFVRRPPTAGLLVLLALLVSFPPLLSRAAAQLPVPPSPAFSDKSLITDGSVYHDVGRLACNVTNFDLIGSKPLIPSTYSSAPSGLWPAPGGKNYLCRAYLWVGGVLSGETSVSTEGELRSTEDPLDVIYEMAHGDPGGSRYPFPNPDDDADGREDEDPRNGIDDDGDGLVDEDFAAISDQHFRLRMVDNTPEAQAQFPDHRPLNVEVVQQSFQWAGAGLEDFIGFDFSVRNIGATALEDVYIGFFADFDLPLEPGDYTDDLAGYQDGAIVLPDGDTMWAFVGYMHDDVASAPGPRLGVALLGHTTDPAGVTAPSTVRARAFRVYNDLFAYPAGMPRTDSQVYSALSTAGRTANRDGPLGDYKFLLSVGPFSPLAPGAAVAFQVALVAGADLEAMLQTAGVAKRAWLGRTFDRDGDPATGVDGKEYRVRWLPPSQVPTPAASGWITAALLPPDGRTGARAVKVGIEARHVAAAGVALERSGPQAADHRLWTAEDLWGPDDPAPGAGEEEGVCASLLDTDPAGWPRIYRLLLSGTAVGARELARIDVAEPPPASRPTLSAHPNPFNPQTTIGFTLPSGGGARLAIYDAAGRLVRTLVEADLPAGGHETVWDGKDSRGLGVASGSYFVRLFASGMVETTRLGLVR